jgi:hypothetical protein
MSEASGVIQASSDIIEQRNREPEEMPEDKGARSLLKCQRVDASEDHGS